LPFGLVPTPLAERVGEVPIGPDEALGIPRPLLVGAPNVDGLRVVPARPVDAVGAPGIDA